jgi:uncharacterized protein YggE
MGTISDNCERMKSIKILSFAILALVIAAAQAQAGEDRVRTITVQGAGEATSVPDVARINVGVVSEAKTAGEALSANNEAMTRLFTVLDEFDVAGRDRQTTGFNVSPRYDRPGRDGGTPEIVGYQVNNQVSVRVRKLDDLGKLLDALVKDGANRIHGIGFALDDPTAIYDEARKNAIADAKRRADLYAAALGVEVGSVVNVTELSIRSPRTELSTARMMAAKAVPVAPGEQEFSASVTVVFEIDD